MVCIAGHAVGAVGAIDTFTLCSRRSRRSLLETTEVAVVNVRKKGLGRGREGEQIWRTALFWLVIVCTWDTKTDAVLAASRVVVRIVSRTSHLAGPARVTAWG